MELLLNICWLLVAVAAILIWRRQWQSARRGRPLVCLLALSCVLVLLFPIISESDDLHAMRQEMEESSAKVKAGESDRASHLSAKLHAPALPVSAHAIRPAEVVVGFVEAGAWPRALAIFKAQPRDRAPPLSLL